MNHGLTSLVAAKVGTAFVDSLDRMDSTVLGVDRMIQAWVNDLIQARSYAQTWHYAASLNHRLANTLYDLLTGLIQQNHQATAKTLARTIPERLLQAAIKAPLETLREDVSVGFARRPVVRSEPVRPRMTKREKRDAFQELLLPSLPAAQVDRIIYGTSRRNAFARIQTISRLADPAAIAATVSQGVTSGMTRAQIGKELEPLVGGVRSAAKRLARTEGARVSNEANMAAYEQLGTAVIGYQIHAVLDERTRPEHAARNGTIYYREPKSGQLGFDKMPRPPLEADGTVAHNCRCFLSPVFADDPAITDDPAVSTVFTSRSGDVIPDPDTYQSWWSQASERKQRQAVGSTRYDTLVDILGRAPEWVEFVDPETGKLIPTDDLQDETEAERAERVALMRDVMAQRRAAIHRVLTFGTTQ